METVTDNSALLDLNEFQEKLLSDFIESGGRQTVYQRGRGYGYTTFAMYLCIHQLLTTRRRVAFVSDMPIHLNAMTVYDTACRFFGAKAQRNDKTGGFLINGNYLFMLNPKYPSGLYGRRFYDIYGDIRGDSYDKHREFFYILPHRTGSSEDDGTGFHYMVVW